MSLLCILSPPLTSLTVAWTSCSKALLRLRVDYPLTPGCFVRYPSRTKSSADPRALFCHWASRQTVETKYDWFPSLLFYIGWRSHFRRLSQTILDKVFYGIPDLGRECLLVLDEPEVNISSRLPFFDAFCYSSIWLYHLQNTYDAAIDTLEHVEQVVDSLYAKVCALYFFLVIIFDFLSDITEFGRLQLPIYLIFPARYRSISRIWPNDWVGNDYAFPTQIVPVNFRAPRHLRLSFMFYLARSRAAFHQKGQFRIPSTSSWGRCQNEAPRDGPCLLWPSQVGDSSLQRNTLIVRPLQNVPQSPWPEYEISKGRPSNIQNYAAHFQRCFSPWLCCEPSMYIGASNPVQPHGRRGTCRLDVPYMAVGRHQRINVPQEDL